MENTKELSIALRSIQNQVIGLFRPTFYPVDHYIPVITNDKGVLTCIEVGRLLGLSTLTIGQEAGRYVPFTTQYGIAKTLAEMMEDPIAFDKWYKANITP